MADLKNTTINDTGFFRPPVGTTSERPSSPVIGMARINTDLEDTPVLEFYDGSDWQIIAFPANIFGTGKEGNVTTNGVVNSYYYVTSSSQAAGSSSISVNSTTGLSSGDSILIHQTQDYVRGPNNIGLWEFNTIASISGTTLILEDNLVNTYYSNDFNSADAIVTQVVRVPEYENLTLNGDITSPAYDGFSGGIVAIKCTGTFNFNSRRIENGNSSQTSGSRYQGKGFRGGSCGGCGNSDWGDVGEGWRGRNGQDQTSNRGDNGGAGGYGPSGTGGTSAGGGGNGGFGGQGRDTSSQPTPEGGENVLRANDFDSCFKHLVFGGGAGGGGDNDDLTPFAQFVEGGGVVIVVAEEIFDCAIENDGSAGIIGNNSTGYDYNTNDSFGGKTGGGAGGSTVIVSNNLNTSSSGYIRQRGGPGAWHGDYPHYAGDGGGGRLAILEPVFSSGSLPSSVGFNSNTFQLFIDSVTNHNQSENRGQEGIFFFGDVSESESYAGFR